tara:strand:+ start:707 stop:868 length:162 start_codon:yes stop_codon:yes gene_type:complete
MMDARQIMRAMLLGLAPPEHRALSVAELQRLGYRASTAEALALAAKEQQQTEN